MNSTATLKSIIIALLILLGLSLYINTKEVQNIGESFCTDFSQEKPSTLETGLIGDMVSIYRNNQLAGINSQMRSIVGSQFEGSESILFDLKIVSKFLYQIKQGVTKNGKNLQDEELGLRFYYAAYPEKAKWGRSGYVDLEDIMVNADTYQKKHTLVILAPRVNAKNEVVDFDPFDIDTYEDGLPKYERVVCESEYIDGELRYIETENCFKPDAIDQNPEAKKATFSISGSNTENGNTFSKNHGQLYPPYSSSGIAF